MFTIASLGLAVAIIATAPGAWSSCNGMWRAKRKGMDGQHWYEDEDGSATEESQSAYSDRWPTLVLLASTVGGLLVSIVAVVLSYRGDGKSTSIPTWLHLSTWVRG